MGRVILTSSFPTDDCDYPGHFVASEAQEAARAGEDVTVLAPGRPQLRDKSAPYVTVRLGGDALFGPPGASLRVQQNPLRLGGLLPVMARARRWLTTHPTERLEAHWLLPSALPILTPWPGGTRLPPHVELVAHGSDVRLLCRLPQAALERLVRYWLERGWHLRFVAKHLRDSLADQLSPVLRRTVLAQSSVRAARLDLQLGTAPVPPRPPGYWRAVVVGRLIPSKGVDRALSALLDAQAQLDAPGEVVVVGDGPERSTLSALAPQAHFLGELPRSTTLSWIESSDVLVSASTQEGAPTTVREALALGVQVVCSPVGVPSLAAWLTGAVAELAYPGRPHSSGSVSLHSVL